MANFMGSYEHTLDEKGRLMLPASFRLEFAAGAVTVPYDRCLAILPPNEYARMANSLKGQVAQGKANADHLRAFASLAETITPDSQGRIRLPPRLRTLAGLDREVLVAGVFERVEIWNPRRWEANFPSGAAQFVSPLIRQYELGSNITEPNQ